MAAIRPNSPISPIVMNASRTVTHWASLLRLNLPPTVALRSHR